MRFRAHWHSECTRVGILNDAVYKLKGYKFSNCVQPDWLHSIPDFPISINVMCVFLFIYFIKICWHFCFYCRFSAMKNIQNSRFGYAPMFTWCDIEKKTWTNMPWLLLELNDCKSVYNDSNNTNIFKYSTLAHLKTHTHTQSHIEQTATCHFLSHFCSLC